jgi:hypothetical protein
LHGEDREREMKREEKREKKRLELCSVEAKNANEIAVG